MCGRVNTYNKASIYDIMRMFSDDNVDDFDARYNVAPGSRLAALYHQQAYHAIAMHWGLVPLWAKPGTFKRPLINARAETIFDKPSFRTLVRNHRCLVPVNGFYEWRRSDDGKTPFYFLPEAADTMLLAGIYQFNKQDEAECCLVTTDANTVMRPVHDRMPVVIAPDAAGDWLSSEDRGQLESLMRPGDAAGLRCYQVSGYVSRAGNDGARCIEAAG